jgi:hypothetical protein
MWYTRKQEKQRFHIIIICFASTSPIQQVVQ